MRAAIGMGLLLVLSAALNAEESGPRAGVPTFLPAHPFVHRPGRPYINRAENGLRAPGSDLAATL